MTGVSYFGRVAPRIKLFGSTPTGWRGPQIGALGAIISHWSLAESEPTVISIPTGSGKTAVAMATPFLPGHTPQRVLVLAPARQIRAQLVSQFSTYAQLQRLAVVPKSAGAPRVFEMSGRTSDWSELQDYDVVIALPNSISPA